MYIRSIDIVYLDNMCRIYNYKKKTMSYNIGITAEADLLVQESVVDSSEVTKCVVASSRNVFNNIVINNSLR